MTRLVAFAFAAVSLAALARTAAAQSYTPPQGPAHEGLYIHLHLGPAYTSFGDDQLKVHGTGGSFDLAVGGAIRPRVIVFAEVFDDIAQAPSVEIGGQTGTTSDDTNAGVIGVGGGVAYYTPSNIYVAATLAAAKITVQTKDDTSNSDFGPGVSLKVGKEWMVSPKWGLGVGGQMFLGSVKENNDSAGLFGAALVFSATYN
jgi:hypothetical protein